MSDEIKLENPIALNPQASEFETIQRQCKMAVMSGFLPDIYTKGDANVQLAKAAVVAMKGRELGVPMMQAFSQINIIKGKPSISAELMLALIFRAHPDADIDFVRIDSKGCEIMAARPGKTARKFSFDEADAKAAGLLNNDNYRKYARAMYRSRAVSEMARSIFPDAIMGCSYTPEELGANVNEDGELRDVKGTERATEPMPGRADDAPENNPTEPKPAQVIETNAQPCPDPVGTDEGTRPRDPEPLKNHAPRAENQSWKPTGERQKSDGSNNSTAAQKPKKREHEKTGATVDGEPIESKTDKAIRLAQFIPDRGKFKDRKIGECDRQEVALWLAWCKNNDKWGALCDTVCEFLQCAYDFDTNFMSDKESIERQFSKKEADFDTPFNANDIQGGNI